MNTRFWFMNEQKHIKKLMNMNCQYLTLKKFYYSMNVIKIKTLNLDVHSVTIRLTKPEMHLNTLTKLKF